MPIDLAGDPEPTGYAEQRRRALADQAHVNLEVRVVCPRHRPSWLLGRCALCGPQNGEHAGTVLALLAADERERLAAPYRVALQYALDALITVAGAEPVVFRMGDALHRARDPMAPTAPSGPEWESQARALADRYRHAALSPAPATQLHAALCAALAELELTRRLYENERHDAMLALGAAVYDTRRLKDRAERAAATERQHAAAARLDRLDAAVQLHE